MRILITTTLLFILNLVSAGFNGVAANDAFWQSPQQSVQQSSTQTSSMFANLATTEQVDVGGQAYRSQEVSITQAFSPSSALTFQYANAGEQRNYVLGFQQKNVSVSMLRGSGEDISQLGGDYNGVDPYLFHGGYKQDFDVSGYALDYRFGRLGHLQFGQAVVAADGLLDRKAKYFEWSNNRYFARVSEFNRGSESIGNGLDFGVAFSGKRVAVQTMNLENNKRMQRIRFEFDGKKSRQYWLDFSAHQNPLFEANNDYRVMFNFRTLLGAKKLASYQNDQSSSAGENAEEGAIEDESGSSSAKKKKKGGWQRTVLIGAGIAAAASLSSSGSSQVDENIRFNSTIEAARDVLNSVNPQSIRLNREFGGWIFVNLDGSFGSSTPVQGEAASVRLPDPAISVPAGSRIMANYHTHAAFDPRFDNENFSQTDLDNNRRLGIDGFLGTPLGQFKLHDVETDRVSTLGTIATE